MIRLPKIFKNSIIYSFVTILQKGIAFFLLPLYTAFLTPEDYGTINVVLAVSSLLSQLIMLALNGAATRFHYNTDDEERRKVLWGTISSLVIISTIGWSAVFFFLHRYLVDPFVGAVDFYPFVVLGLINTALAPLYILFQSYLQARQNAVQYGINTLSNFLIHLGLAVFLIAYLRLGALGMLLANVITSLLFFIYVIIVFVPKVCLGINKDVSKAAFKYSLPLLPHQLSMWGAGTIDRLLLNDLKGKSDTGLYSVAQQFGSVIGSFTFAVNQAFVPWFFEQLRNGEKGIGNIVKVADFAVIGYCLIALFISLFAPEVLQFMVSEDYRMIWQILPFVCFAYVFQGIYYMFINVLFIKDTSFVFIVTLTGLLVNIIANIFFIPLWGLMGCAMACFISYFVRSLMAMFISIVKNKEIRYHYTRIFLITFVLLAVSLVNWIIPDTSIIVSLFFKFALITVLCIVFYVPNKRTIQLLIKRCNK